MSEPIRIGFPIPLTSVYGVEALDRAQAAQVAVDEFNSQGGWNGREAELIIRDTKMDLNLGRELATDLIEKEKVDFVVGALSASEMVAIGQTCAHRKIVYNGISVGDDIVSGQVRSPYIFHEGPSAFGTADTIGRFAFSHYGFKAATLVVDHPVGRDSLRGLLSFANIGVDFAAQEFHAMGEKNFPAIIERIAAARPEVLITTNFGSDQLNMLEAIRKIGLHRETRVTCFNVSIPMRERSGAELFEGVVGTSGYYWKLEERYESSRSFNNRYRAKYGVPPAAHGSFAYGGVRALLTAARKMNSLKSEDLIEGLLGLRFDFCRGPQFYRRMDHQSIQPVVILESKSANEMQHKHDVFEILSVAEFTGPRSFHSVYEKS